MKCVNCLQVSPKTVSLQRGKWYYGMSVQVFPSDADCRCATWHSENPQVASVNASSGYIYAQSAGTVRIYATATDGSGCRDFVTVTVKDSIPVESVTLNRTSLTLEKGKTATLGVTICPTNATNRNVNWTSSNNGVATVNNGIITAVSNGSARITATAADGSGKSASCMVTVTGDTLVTSISVSPNCSTMTAGSTRVFHATVYPSGATNKGVTWSSSNETIATVNPNSGMVTAKRAGNVQIRATACDRGGVYGVACLQVSVPVAVTGITVYPAKKTLGLDETVSLRATISPSNASNKSVFWSSRNSAVAIVDSNTGVVTPNSAGVATIVATSADGRYEASCEIVVDVRDKVVIKKQGSAFDVLLPSGRIWKGICCDLNDSENRTPNTSLNITYYEYLNITEKRFVDNFEFRKLYTVQELAFLYRIDPLGIEYLMRNGATDRYSDLGQQLLFKDNVYKAIFGEPMTGRFYFTIENEQVCYGTYRGVNRVSLYSNAEILFGSHNIFDWSNFLKGILSGLFNMVSDSLFPMVSKARTGVEVYQALFHSGSFTELYSDKAYDYAKGYCDQQITSFVRSRLGDTASKMTSWALNLVSILASAAINSFEIPNLKDMVVYNKISQDIAYRVVFDGATEDLSIEDIISICSEKA